MELKDLKVGDTVIIESRWYLGFGKIDRITPSGLIGIGKSLFDPITGRRRAQKGHDSESIVVNEGADAEKLRRKMIKGRIVAKARMIIEIVSKNGFEDNITAEMESELGIVLKKVKAVDGGH